jgi:uncharacterized protein (DUF1697 family)
MAHIALLDEIAHGQAVAQISSGNVHHEAQVRQHELASRVEVALRTESHRQRDLIVLGQDGDLGNAIDIRVQASDRSRKYQTALFGD